MNFGHEIFQEEMLTKLTLCYKLANLDGLKTILFVS